MIIALPGISQMDQAMLPQKQIGLEGDLGHYKL